MILKWTKLEKKELIIADNCHEGLGFGYELVSICSPNEVERGERTEGKVLHPNRKITLLNNRIVSHRKPVERGKKSTEGQKMKRNERLIC